MAIIVRASVLGRLAQNFTGAYALVETDLNFGDLERKLEKYPERFFSFRQSSPWFDDLDVLLREHCLEKTGNMLAYERSQLSNSYVADFSGKYGEINMLRFDEIIEAPLRHYLCSKSPSIQFGTCELIRCQSR